MQTRDQYKSLRQYVAEQIESSPTFAQELERAREETRFALALAETREARGLTQRELAEITGIKQPMLARIERGQVPTVPTLKRLAAALNVRVVITPQGGVTVETVDAPGITSAAA